MSPGRGGAIGGLPLGTATDGEPGIPWMNVNLDGAVLQNNYAGDDGGAVHTPRGGQLTVTSSTFTGNTAVGSGGALNSFGFGCAGGECYDAGGTGATMMMISDSTFDGNDGGYGQILGNQYVDGANMFQDGPSEVIIERSSIINSTAGGGIDVTVSNLTLRESTLSGNTHTTDGAGAGLFVFDQATYGGTNTYTMTIENSTITNNTSPGYAGGLYASYYGQLDIAGTIVSGNIQSALGDIYNNNNPYHTAVDSVIGNADGTAFTVDGVLVGNTATPVDAMLMPLADNGGPTMTHMPMAGSPALEANASSTSTADQRGAARPWDANADAAGGVADIGSVEFLSPVVVTGVDGDFDNDGDYDCDDINALQAEIVAGTNDAAFDLTDDGIVDDADQAAWLIEGGNAEVGGPFLDGDFNLDGSVDVSDFNIWNNNKFTTNSNWCDGDANADGSIDVSDFNIWNVNKFNSSVPIVANSVSPQAVGGDIDASSLNAGGQGQLAAQRQAALQNKLTYRTTFHGEIAQRANNFRSMNVQGLKKADAAPAASNLKFAGSEVSDLPAANQVNVDSVAGEKSEEASVNSGRKIESTADGRLRISAAAEATDAIFADLGGL